MTLHPPRNANSNSAYSVVPLASGATSIRCGKSGETFHPVIGPAAEAEALYVRQFDLAGRMAAQPDPFVIWDVGLGGAANVMAVLRAVRHLDRDLRVVSFDHTLAALEFALRHSAELGYFGDCLPIARSFAAEGSVSARCGSLHLHWDLHLGDFPSLLSAEANSPRPIWPKPDVIFYDAFSPARNPDMWTLDLFRNLRSLIEPTRACALATYSRSTMLRVTLLTAGFFVGQGAASGEKEETTIGATALELIPRPLGKSWLGRAFRSKSAEPLAAPVYAQLPLTAATRDSLLSHPQFAVAPEPHPIASPPEP